MNSSDTDSAPPARAGGREFRRRLEALLRPLRDPDEVLAITSAALGEHLGASRVGYGQLIDDARILHVPRDWTDGLTPSIAGRHVFADFGRGVIAVHRSAGPFVLGDARSDARLAEARQWLESIQLIACITVPLLRDGRTVGLLSVQQSRPRAWRPDEIALVEEVAERTWAAFEHAKAEERLREAERKQAFLLGLGDRLRHVTDPAEVLAIAAERLGRHLGIQRAGYAEVEPDGVHFVIEGGWTDGSVELGSGRYRVDAFGEAATASLLRGESQRIADAETDPRIPPANRIAYQAMRIAAVITVPLIKDGRFAAMLSVHSATPRVWSDAEVALVEDVAERTWSAYEWARAELELARSREALFQSEKTAALGSLLAGVSHELNNPLSIVVAHALLLEEEARDSAFAGDAATIRRAAERCARIVQSFLAMARRRPPARSRVHLAGLVAQALELTRYGLRSAGIELLLDFPADLPPVDGDPDQLHQVFANLFVNATQALAEAPPPRRLEVSGRVEGGRLVVDVADNGPGIAAEVAGRIFEPFFTTKAQGGGTGLGLSFSSGIVEAHGGRLELVEGGGGATFRVTLPIGAGALPEAPAPRPSAARGDAPQRRALIVDDEPEVAGALARILAGGNHEVTIVASGAEAIAALARESVDLILSDVHMAQGDGAFLHAWLKAQRPDLLPRLAFMTGDTFGGGSAAFLSEAGCPVLEKPFTPEAVRDLVVRLGGGSGAA